MRYFVSSMALSKPIWSFCTMPNMLLRAETRVQTRRGARARAGEFKADAHISWAIAVRTERRGRSLGSAQKRQSVGAGVCTGVLGRGTKSASSPLLDVVCTHKQIASVGCTVSCRDTESSTGRAGARTAEVVITARQVLFCTRTPRSEHATRGWAWRRGWAGRAAEACREDGVEVAGLLDTVPVNESSAVNTKSACVGSLLLQHQRGSPDRGELVLRTHAGTRLNAASCTHREGRDAREGGGLRTAK